MLSILGSLLGFASSAVPAITDSFAQKTDNKHELDKMKLMAELKAAGYDHDLKVYEQMGADKEHDRLIQHDIAINRSSGIIAGLQKSVRPVITYAFFILFATIEITLLINELINLLFLIKLSNLLNFFGLRPINNAGSMPTSDKTEYLPPI